MRMRLASVRALAVLALAASLLSTGCLTTFEKDEVYGEGDVSVSLRGEKRWFGEVEKRYDHPVTIASVRFVHVLSRIDVRESAKDGNRRTPAVPTELLTSVADGMSRAFSRATPDQEVVVLITRKQRRFGVFDRSYLTSFVAYVRDGALAIHLSRIDWEIPERRDMEIPEPRIGEHPQKFRVFPGEAMRLLDAQTVAIDWRDPIFSRPTRTKVLPTGEVVRKTILLESPAEQVENPAPSQAPPPGLSPEQLRALADLEEARRNGDISEADYRSRRREIVEP